MEDQLPKLPVEYPASNTPQRVRFEVDGQRKHQRRSTVKAVGALVQDVAVSQAMLYRRVSRRPGVIPRGEVEVPSRMRAGPTDLKRQSLADLVGTYEEMTDSPNPMEQHAPLGPLAVASTFVKAMMGTSLMMLAQGLKTTGLTLGIVSLMICAFATAGNAVLLLSCRAKVEELTGAAPTFGEIGRFLRPGVYDRMVDMSILASQCGYIVTLVIFVGNILHSILMDLMNCPSFLNNIAPMESVFLLLPIFILLASIRHLKMLGPTNIIGNFFMGWGIVVVLVYTAKPLMEGRTGPDLVPLATPMGWVSFQGQAIYLFEGVTLVIPVSEVAANPNQLPIIIAGVIVALGAFLSLFGAVGYLAYGTDTDQIVMLNLPGNAIVAMSKLLYVLALVCTFPLTAMPFFDIAEEPVLDKLGLPKKAWAGNIFRACSIVMMFVVAYIGDSNLQAFIGVIGGLCCIPIAVLYPAVFYLELFSREGGLSARATIGLYAIIIFGMCSMVSTTGSSLVAWIETHRDIRHQPDCYQR